MDTQLDALPSTVWPCIAKSLLHVASTSGERARGLCLCISGHAGAGLPVGWDGAGLEWSGASHARHEPVLLLPVLHPHPEWAVFSRRSSFQVVSEMQSGYDFMGRVTAGHSNRIYAAKFAEPNVLLTGGWDKTVQVWPPSLVFPRMQSLGLTQPTSVLGIAGVDGSSRVAHPMCDVGVCF